MTRSPHRPGWLSPAWRRHATAAALFVALTLLFRFNAPGGRSGGLWNPPLAWASMVLLGVVLMIGPLARLWLPARALVGLRRELGIWAAVALTAHVAFVLHEWAGWSLGPLWRRFDGTQFSLDPGLALANLLGTIALAYGLALGLTSSDAAQRWLGKRWKALQRGATTLFLLAVLHAVFFLYLDRGGGLGHVPFRGYEGRFELDRVVFPVLVVGVLLVRAVAFWRGRRG